MAYATLRESTVRRPNEVSEVISHDFFPAVIGGELNDLRGAFSARECEFTCVRTMYDDDSPRCWMKWKNAH